MEQSANNTTSTENNAISVLLRICEAVELAVACLYRLPLRKPAPMDRLEDRYIDKREPSPYGPYDEAYIRDKFPNLVGEVRERLATMITKRRKLLQYRQEHGERLGKRQVSSPGLEAGEAAAPGPAASDATGAPLSQKPASQSPSRPRTELTKATTLKIDPDALAPVIRVEPERLESVPVTVNDDDRTSVAASTFTREIRLEVPPRPKHPDGQPQTSFSCRYCCIPTYIVSSRQWRYLLSNFLPTFETVRLTDDYE